MPEIRWVKAKHESPSTLGAAIKKDDPIVYCHLGSSSLRITKSEIEKLLGVVIEKPPEEWISGAKAERLEMRKTFTEVCKEINKLVNKDGDLGIVKTHYPAHKACKYENGNISLTIQALSDVIETYARSYKSWRSGKLDVSEKQPGSFGLGDPECIEKCAAFINAYFK